MTHLFKTYYNLTKPGIIYGNALTAMAGFFCAIGVPATLAFRPLGGLVILFITMLVGLSLVIAAGCVFNNIWDADIDSNMDRTKNRAMVTGAIKKTHAIVFGLVLIVVGILALSPLPLALYTALLGFIVYIFLYTPLKRKTIHATLIGAIAGATPPVVGYTAVSGRLDVGAIILFFILIFWQMPHFFSIAIYRLKDYAAAGIPVWPVKKGVAQTKIYIILYIVAFAVAALSLFVYHYTGLLYLIFISLITLLWLRLSIQGLKVGGSAKWAKKIFLFSLIVISSWCAIIVIDSFLH